MLIRANITTGNTIADSTQASIVRVADSVVSFLSHIENIKGRVFVHCLAGTVLYYICATNRVKFHSVYKCYNRALCIICRCITVSISDTDAYDAAPPTATAKRFQLCAVLQDAGVPKRGI